MRKSFKLTAFLFMMAVFSGSAQTSGQVSTPGSAEKAVKVYYFHATARCATCNAVEKVTTEALKEFYGKKVSFESINREKNKDHDLIIKHKISGQTLLVICGEQVINLTNDAFLNARTKPEKLREKLKSTIDPLLAG